MEKGLETDVMSNSGNITSIFMLSVFLSAYQLLGFFRIKRGKTDFFFLEKKNFRFHENFF